MPNRKQRQMKIRIERKAKAKRKVEEGYRKVVERKDGAKKIRFIKPDVV